MGIKVELTVKEGADTGKVYEFSDGKITLGRRSPDFKIEDRKVSGEHCSLMIMGEQVFIEDNGSTNGTYLSGKKVESQVEVHNLDTITIGLSNISVTIVEELTDFKKANTGSGAESFAEPTRRAQAAASPALEPVELPDDDAKYRETGIRRISDLIDDELQTFSGEAPTERVAPKIPKMIASFKVKSCPDTLADFTLDKPVLVMGRKGVDIKINDLDISRKHAQLEKVGSAQIFVKDLGSTNGTFVNDERIQEKELQSGDTIQVGQTFLEVTIERA